MSGRSATRASCGRGCWASLVWAWTYSSSTVTCSAVPELIKAAGAMPTRGAVPGAAKRARVQDFLGNRPRGSEFDECVTVTSKQIAQRRKSYRAVRCIEERSLATVADQGRHHVTDRLPQDALVQQQLWVQRRRYPQRELHEVDIEERRSALDAVN